MKTGLRTASDILTLISAIIQTVLLVFYLGGIVLSNSMINSMMLYSGYYNDVIVYGYFKFIMTIVVVVYAVAVGLLWFTKNKAASGSKAWSIYGIVHTCLSFDIIGLAGYICSVIDLSKNGDETELKKQEKDLERNIRIAKLEKELEELKK